jgi:hypothetical protein
MTSRLDPDPEIAAWLNDAAPVRAPEHLLTSSRARIQSTHQRRAWGPARRLPDMNSQFRLVGALAAIAVVVAVLGLALIPKPAGVGGLGPTAVPTATPTAVPSASPSPGAKSTASSSPAVISPGTICSLTSCLTGSLEAGTYSFAGGPLSTAAVTPADVTFTVPAGWTTDSGYVSKGGTTPGTDLGHLGTHEVFFATFPITNVFADACHWTTTLVSAGTTVDHLTSLLIAQKGGRVASAPTNVTLGGLPAKRIQFTVPSSVQLESCDSGVGLLHFWPDPGGTSDGGNCCSPFGSLDVVYVLRVAGEDLIVLTREAVGATRPDVDELMGILASMRIQAPTSSGASSSGAPTQGGAAAASASDGPNVVMGTAPGTLDVTVGSREAGFAYVTCQSQGTGQWTILTGDSSDGVHLIFGPDRHPMSLSGAIRGVSWTVNRNPQGVLFANQSGTFSGTDDISGGAVSGTFACP